MHVAAGTLCLILLAASDKMLSDMCMACLTVSVMMGTTQPSMTGQQMLMDTVLVVVAVVMSVLSKHTCVLEQCSKSMP